MSDHQVNAGARLDRLRFNKAHGKLFAILGAGLFLDAMEIYMGGSILAVLVQTGWSDMNGNANFLSATFAGAVIGALSAGLLGDRFGRRAAFQINLAIFGLASLAAAAAPTMAWLVAIRFVMGIGLGAEAAIGYAVVSEFMPARQRGKWLAFSALIGNGPLLVSTILGYWVIPTIGWRWMFIIVGLFALVVWVLRWGMPESPRWLESKGRMAEAEAIVLRFEAAAGAAILEPVMQVGSSTAPGRFGDLFRRDLRPRTIAAIVITIAQVTAVFGFLGWLPTFMVAQGLSVVKSLQFAMLTSAGAPVGSLIGMVLSDKIGRRRGLVACSVFGILIGSCYPFVRSINLLTLVGFLLVTNVYLMVSFGLAGYIPELFPTNLRMRGAAFASTVGRGISVLTPFLIVYIFSIAGVGGVLLLLSTVLLIQALYIGLGGIETRLRPLEALDPGASPAE
jgi:putative MFS transporter